MTSTNRTHESRFSRIGLIVFLVASIFSIPSQTFALSNEGRKPIVDRIFVIMLENHSQTSVIGDKNAPFINHLAKTFAMAANYYGVTHPSLPNYIAATSGSNWFVNDDKPDNRFDHTNLVDQLEQHNIPWAAYMEAMPNPGYLEDFFPTSKVPLYASKHNPFVLYPDIRNEPKRLNNIKPYTVLADDLNGQHPPSFVWISPDQCNDMHGGVNESVPNHPETPCPYGNLKGDLHDSALKQNADTFVKQTVTLIMTSRAWTPHSVIFIVTDESDYTPSNISTDGWESTEHCCDSPVLPDGYPFQDDGKPNPKIWHGINNDFTYGGGRVPAVIVAPAGRHVVSSTRYNHYSLLRTIEEVWGLGYLGYASDAKQINSMTEFLVP